MAKKLKDILEVAEPKSPDERRFKDKHITVKHKDRNGNDDKLFNASNIKTVERSKERHGYDAGQDEDVYEAHMTAADKAKEKKIKAKTDKSGMKASMQKQYGAEKGKSVYFATIRKQAMESVEQIDELKMSHGAYVSAMKRTTGYDAGSDEGRVDSNKLVARAKREKGEKFAHDLKGADQMTERPNRNKVSGQWGSDKLAWRSPAKTTKAGKANKTSLGGLKASLKKGDYRKPEFSHKKRLPEEFEQIDEAVAGDIYDAHHARAMKSLKNMMGHLEKHKKLCCAKGKSPASWHAADMKTLARNFEDMEHNMAQQNEYATPIKTEVAGG